MITRMHVERFRAISDVTVRLGNFNVLIGPNDQGKTSFLEAVYALAAATRNSIADCFWSPWRGRNLVHQGDSKGIGLSASLGGNERSQADLEYSLTVRPHGDGCLIAQETAGPNGPVLLARDMPETMVWRHLRGEGINPDYLPLVQTIAQRLPSPALTRWNIEELGIPSMLPPNRPQAFDPTGYGLGTCLAEQKLASDETFDRISSQFCHLFSEFRGIGFRRVTGRYWFRGSDKVRNYGNSGDGYEMLLHRRDGTEVPANLVSGGVLVTLAFLTIAELNGDLLLVEEPENGLHPARLQGIVEMLRKASAGRPGSQIILTTHSPLLLDYVQPEEVRLFARNKRGEVEVHHLEDIPDIKDRLKYVMLGELVFSDWDNFIEEIREHANPAAR